MYKKLCFIDAELIRLNDFDLLAKELIKNDFDIFTVIGSDNILIESQYVKVFVGKKDQNFIENICLNLNKTIDKCIFIYPENHKFLMNIPRHHLFEIKENDKDCFFQFIGSIRKYLYILRVLRKILIISILILDLLLFLNQYYSISVILLVLNFFLFYLLISPLSIITLSYFLQILFEVILQMF